MTHQPKSEPTRESSRVVRYLPVLLVVTVIVLLGLPLVVISMPQAIRIPVVVDHEGDPPAAALFSHWAHDQFKCYNCHWSVFPMEKKGFTHEEMDEGKYCGACHNGRLAWGIEDLDTECITCHVEGGYGFSPEMDEEDEADEDEADEEEAEREEVEEKVEAAEEAGQPKTEPAAEDVQAETEAADEEVEDEAEAEAEILEGDAP